MQDHLPFLSSLPLFRGIPAEELPALLSALHAARRETPAGTLLLRAGEAAGRAGLLLSGSAQILYEDAFGRRSILHELEPGELFGEAFCLAGAPAQVSVTALAGCAVLWLELPALFRPGPAEAARQQLTGNLVQVLAAKNITLNQKIRCLSRRTTREKLLAYLSDQAAAAGGRTFTIPFRRQELADYLCVERSAMSAELGKLKREGILDFDRSTFRLLRGGEKE